MTANNSDLASAPRGEDAEGAMKRLKQFIKERHPREYELMEDPASSAIQVMINQRNVITHYEEQIREICIALGRDALKQLLKKEK